MCVLPVVVVLCSVVVVVVDVVVLEHGGGSLVVDDELPQFCTLATRVTVSENVNEILFDFGMTLNADKLPS